MRASSTWFLAASVLCVGLTLGGADGRAAVQRPFPTINVSGEGTATVVPDLAEVTAGVSTEGKTAREAAEANARAMSAVVAAARQAGIAEADIRTARYSIFPVHGTRRREDAPQIVGYRAANQVHLKLRNIEKVGEILDVLIAAGANNVANVAFSASNPAQALDEARAAAFADAKRKAELYARAAGGQAGRALSIAEQEAHMPRPIAYHRAAAAEAAPPTPIAPGEETLRVQVTVSFELLH